MEINILTFFLFYFLISFSVLGYGNLFIKNFSNYNHKINIGFTGIVGVFFLIIISIASHFFFKHGIIHNIIILIIGLFFFLKNINLYSNKDFKIFIITFLILFIAILIKKNHDDFGYYHFPYTFYIIENSQMVGIGKFVHGLRTPSSIFYLNSIFYLPLIKYYMFNIGALLIMGFANIIILKRIESSFNKRDFNYLFIFNLLIFSFINIFFYRLAEHGTDKSAQILILLFVYEILYYINKKGAYKEFYSNSLVFLGLIISFKPFYILYLIFSIPIIIIIKKYNQIKKLNEIMMFKNIYFNFTCIIILFTIFLFFINTGCLVYPVAFTCFESFSWSIPIDQVKAMNNWYEQWSKAGAGPNFRVENPEIYIQNFNWVSHWVNEYFFNKVSDYLIGLFVLYLIFFMIFFKKMKKTKNELKFKNPNIKFIYLTILLLFFEWFYNHPALRYGGYILIFLLFSIPFSVYLEKFIKNLNYLQIYKKFKIIFSLVLLIFLARNIDRISDENKIYEKISLKNVSYLIDDTSFRVDKQIKNLKKKYYECENNGVNCNILIKKESGMFVFPFK